MADPTIMDVLAKYDKVDNPPDVVVLSHHTVRVGDPPVQGKGISPAWVLRESPWTRYPEEI